MKIESSFERSNYSLDDVYRSLTFLNDKADDLQLWINDRIKEKYGRDTSLVYYDVTNYYFESDTEDDFRRRGVSKSTDPIRLSRWDSSWIRMESLLPMTFIQAIPMIL